VPLARPPSDDGPDSPAAWRRLMVSLALMTLGASGMYVVSVVIPEIQSEFGASRAEASLPYTLTMIGFGLGGVWMGWLTDRRGIAVPLLIGGAGLGLGFVAAGASPSLLGFALAQGLLMGLLGVSATFAPLMADTTLWFNRRRGIAVAICASGNYLGGALWPPVVQALVEAFGLRVAYAVCGAICLATMLPLALLMRRRPPALQPEHAARSGSAAVSESALPSAAESPAATEAQAAHAPGVAERPLGLAPNTLLLLLCVAGVACCVAMAMPQVHIVAYCTDLGFGAVHGAQMLSVMLGSGIVSRLLSGWIADRIGGLRTLLLNAVLQCVALAMFVPFDGLVSLYLLSLLFGLFQGGLVPSYALAVRELYPPQQVGSRVAIVITCTMLGMALGGWLSGVLFDLTGGYRAAFVNGVAWNLVTIAVAVVLVRRAPRRDPHRRVASLA
jgi:MFS family permease